MVKADYKVIEFSITDLEKRSLNLLSINSIGSQNDFYFDLNDQVLVLYLKQMDLNKFKTFIDNNVEHNDVLRRVYSKVEAIGSYGVKGKKRLFVGYNKERKVSGRKKKEEERSKHYYSEGNNFSKSNNEISDEFVNKIVCEDSETYLRKLPDNCIDLIFTSPPYNFGLAYENHHDSSFWEEYFNKLFAIFDECIRVVKWGGRIMVNVQPLFSDYIPSHHIISNHFLLRKLIWKGEILWEKNNYNCKYTAWGSYMSPSSPYLKYTWEFIEIFCKGELIKRGEKSKIDISAEEFKNWVVAKWSVAPERKMKEYGHPAMFPESLVDRALKLFSYQGDVILDPFNGAGTTTYVAKKLNRRFIGIDTSQDYCNTAMKRLENLVDNPRLF